jgi:hypothetical protein
MEDENRHNRKGSKRPPILHTGGMTMACLRRILPVLALAPLLGVQSTEATTPLALLTIHLSDLRPGYLVNQTRSFTRSSVEKREPVAGPLLLSHGWLAGYQALYERRENRSIQVGEVADRFRTAQGAHWWYGVSLLRVPSVYRSVRLAQVGEESSGVESRGYVGIIFRRGAYVIDIYVSRQAPSPPYSALALARLVDRRVARDQASSHHLIDVHAWVRPNPLSAGAVSALYARTVPGAICTARVADSAGRPSRSFNGFPQRAGRRGMVHWTWRDMMPAGTGTGTVTCSLGSHTTSGQARFTVTR